MRSISVRALALLCLVGLAACVGSPEVVGSATRWWLLHGGCDARPGCAEIDGAVRRLRDVDRHLRHRGLGAPRARGGLHGRPRRPNDLPADLQLQPERSVRAPRGRGVDPGRAHRRGLEVVAWYLPGFRDAPTDLRRAIRSIRFRTGRGNRFDSFALDIESSEVRRPGLRTTRLLRMSAVIRRTAGADYPLGAIVASPHRMVRTDPRFWPGFPWRRLAETYDVFLPMTYYTYRVKDRAPPPGTRRRTCRSSGRDPRPERADPRRRRDLVRRDRARDAGFRPHRAGARRDRGELLHFSGITLDQWKALSALL